MTDLVIRGGTVVDGTGADLPAGEPRFVSRARGVEWSLVNGQPVLEHGRTPLTLPSPPRRGRGCHGLLLEAAQAA